MALADELNDMTNTQLVAEERRLRGEAEKLLNLARRCAAIRVARSATVELREAAAARTRAMQHQR